MIQFPYGIADFRRIRRDGMVYVDRTAHIRSLENLGSNLVFLRPRRFGKSLWIQTLATYYDLRYADAFEDIFGGLDIASGPQGPTPLRNRFFVLQWNFSRVTPRGSVETIAQSLEDHVRSRAKVFVSEYREYLDEPVDTDAKASTILDSLLNAVRKTPYRLYLLIDEYDNFVNEVMVQDVETYKALFEADGPFKELMKLVKNATEGLGLERVFMTGVSPVALNDLTSGFNTATDVSRKKSLAGLCGFYEPELRDLLAPIAAQQQLPTDRLEELVDTMRTWYNGYRFHEQAEGLVYNPTNVLYFLQELYQENEPPRTLHDTNLRTDQAKLAFLAGTDAGQRVVEKLTEEPGEIRVLQLQASFSLGDLTPRLSEDPDAVASFLYYLGLLTLTDEPGLLRIPNLVVRKLFLDRLLEVFLSAPGETPEARRAALSFFQSGDLKPLLKFLEEKLLPVLSNRDRRDSSEMVLKAILLSILFDDQRFVLHSELEADKSYIDLCLLSRPESRYPNAFDILFELKLVSRKTLGKKSQDLRAMDEATLREMPAVKRALSEARDQLGRYRAALSRKYRDSIPRRSYAVVAVGLERLIGEEVTEGAHSGFSG